MNATQRKHLERRIKDIYSEKVSLLRAAMPPSELSDDDRKSQIISGKAKVNKAKLKEASNYRKWHEIYTFQDASIKKAFIKSEKEAEKKIAKLAAERQKAVDCAMLGDSQEAIKILEAFSKFKV